ncbi:MAG TPA: type Z 30S ribosomal protein S14 [Candidatus Bipolaricaulis sp.]|jgi:small subunit ribosomal protein S14|uniref:Small ribosomal subunit protein uS14 n=1 Tax=Candidatus Bipolaricaulis anaerobius TaxID=2026885 RepID=A0A2X3L0H1_9BACT|nr:type Z 30S ribosomal protein S14 [Candidatus Bipolaricaulis anaerobius]MBP7726453.1 type Z 30S ribosomal protein S14 [Candidatus Bipolaricaulis sp.]MDD2912413.1 type Z 30S ribosomal protein S14 [Candidatus Bipolaricaulis anaerobius]MDD5453403.1 type Z 30S ribosomal protein S14 [Candidatus Bipolaricaulis sp.]MDD5763570.1 type Z 30S ribosomal protein S14 [Candidatus Bipolaricaulis anaerobius]MDY0393037.1 type Z 30S ribosomal protein S14 [Candidatus Bipolaricaulis sp.]
MARKAMIEKANRRPKYAVRKRNRCRLCGRSRAYIGDFGLCRLCFRKLALDGQLPGVKKAAW